jgi:hypothetical protein
MSNVVHAFGAAPPSKLQAEMLDEIDHFVEEVKAGRVTGIAIAGVMIDGAASTGFVRAPASHFALVGAVERLKHRMMEHEE